MSKPKKSTPEGEVLQAVKAYLSTCRLGTVHRANVGQVRMGEKTSNHPWAKDTRRVVRFGEPGESDLRVELAGSPRCVFIELKAPTWKAPAHPAPDASASTWEKWRHHESQVRFQARQIARGHVAFFARSVREVYDRLTDAGFLGLPVPQETRNVVKASSATRAVSKSILEQK